MEISFDILGVDSAQAVFVQSELLLRIAIACILGIFIGNERKNRNKSAGVRTHAIVAMGSALMMVVSKYGFADIAELGKFDGSRIAAQVVSEESAFWEQELFSCAITWSAVLPLRRESGPLQA